MTAQNKSGTVISDAALPQIIAALPQEVWGSAASEITVPDLFWAVISDLSHILI